MRFLIYGFIWLFIFSIPVNNGNKKLFDLGYEFIVDSEPVKTITSYLSSVFHSQDSTSLKDTKK